MIAEEIIERRIFLIRGHKVMLDSHLAELYEVETRILIRGVKRNLRRFPREFMFQLTEREYQRLRSQIGISKKGRGGRRYLPYVFTEYGIAMLSSVLNSERATQVNVQIIKAFIKLRRLLASNQHLKKRLDEMERKYDQQFKIVFQAIRDLIIEEEKPKRQIGFHP